MRRFLVFVPSLFFSSGLAAAASAAPLNEIVVTGTLSPQPLDRVPATIRVIDRAQWEKQGAATIAEALRDLPGLSLVQSGGPGAQSSVFLRGADSDHVLVLLDGLPLNDASIPGAAFNFGDDTPANLESIEIAYGPTSIFYGSNAIGGVIQLRTAVGAAKSFSPRIALEDGNHGTWRVETGARGTLGQVDYAAGYEHFSTRGENATPQRIAPNGDADGARIDTGSFNVRWRADENLTVESFIRLRENRFELDNTAADDPNSRGRARSFAWRTAVEQRFAGERGALTLAFAGNDIHREFVNPSNNGVGDIQDDDYDSNRRFADAALRFAPIPQLTLLVGAQWRRDAVEQRALTLFGGTLAFRQTVDRAQSNTAVFAAAQWRPIERLDITAGLRRDDPSDFKAETTSRFGAQLALNPLPVSVFINRATAFNAPTLFDRFGTNNFGYRGNPNLLPETGRSWEVGLRGETLALSSRIALSWQAGYSETRLRNLIQNDFARNTTVNIGRSRLRAADGSVTLVFADMADISLGYAHVDARNAVTDARLLRRPTQQFSLGAGFALGTNTQLNGTFRVIGKRDDVAYDDRGRFLGVRRVAAYSLVDVALRQAFTETVSASLSVRNLFDKAHEPANGFAGPGRSVRLTLRAVY